MRSLQITFLGTASAQPSATRNHSSLALKLDGTVWLFDCGEGTQHQIQKSDIRLNKVEKIFITHTHGDHIFGLVPLLASMMNGAGGTANNVEDPRSHVDHLQPPLVIYGPYGTRAYVRANLSHTYTLLGRPYTVHELRFPDDPQEDPTSLPPGMAEVEGLNIPQTDGVWPNIFTDDTNSVSAAPILHSVPCMGYVVNELPVPGKMDPRLYMPDLKRTNTPLSVLSQLQRGQSVELSDGTVLHGPPRRPGRKVVILGDTHDPSPIVQLAIGADLLVHEATNAFLPDHDLTSKSTDTTDIVEARTKSRGHSTPEMAGIFAKSIQAKRLVLNHSSSRYSGAVSEEACKIMDAIRDLAADKFGADVICARDLMSINVESME